MRKRKMCWRNLWQLVFLAASMLSSCFLLIEGQGVITEIQIKVQPEHPIEGHNVTLTPQGSFSTARSCRWYRGRTAEPGILIVTYYITPKPMQSFGPEFTHRETIGPDCSLHIRTLTARDSGIYTLNVDGDGISAAGYASIVASEYLSSPRLEISHPYGLVTENSDATLICHTSNQSDVSVFWSKDGKSLPSTRVDLSDQNRTLTLTRVDRSDTGTYRCLAKNLISSNESNAVQILVTYGPEMKLNPEGMVYKRLNSYLLVECLVDCYPRAKLQWFINRIRQKENGSLIKVRLRDYNNAGSYTCRATNPFTNHTDEKSCYVILTNGHLSAGAIAGIVIGSVVGVAIVSDFLYFLFKTFFRDRVQPPTSSEEVEETPQAD